MDRVHSIFTGWGGKTHLMYSGMEPMKLQVLLQSGRYNIRI